MVFRLFIRATAAYPPWAPQTNSRYFVIASMPHGVPSHLVAWQRILLVRPLVSWLFIMANRQLTLPAVTG